MTRSRLLGIACFVAAIAIAIRIAATNPPRDERARPLFERLLGPIAEVAATVQWVRVDEAWNHGHPELADARAEFALRLAPGSPSGWVSYAHHLVYDRASINREPDPAERERWVRAGLAILDRGERESRAPGKVAFQRAIVFLTLTQLDAAERPLPVTRRAAWLAAAEAFERAAANGEPVAAQAARAARASASSCPD